MALAMAVQSSAVKAPEGAAAAEGRLATAQDDAQALPGRNREYTQHVNGTTVKAIQDSTEFTAGMAR
jgi:hypothetical protein